MESTVFLHELPGLTADHLATSSAERFGEISGRKLCTDDIWHPHVIHNIVRSIVRSARHLCIKPTGLLVTVICSVQVNESNLALKSKTDIKISPKQWPPQIIDVLQ